GSGRVIGEQERWWAGGRDEDPEQGHCLPSPIDQPALNVKPHSSRCSARSPPLAPSLARDLLS
ncbi:hypothetical protein KUCAC02_018145, partial [Chaenocephalus aceratus]